MYWKIVRINGDGSLRLIYNGTSTTPDYSDIAHSNRVGRTQYNLENNDPKHAGYTYDRDTNETDSFIKREIDTWYKNTLGSNSSYDNKIIGGRFCSDSSGYKGAEDYGFADDSWFRAGNMLYASNDRLNQFITNYAKPNSPTLKCPSTNESYGGAYRLKAGILTADEVVLSGASARLDSYNYLTPDANTKFISMTPYAFDNSSTVWLALRGLHDTAVTTEGDIRSVINVNISGDFTSGDGTEENPYVIS